MSDDNAKFAELCKLPYKRQALWFLNGYWNDVVNPDTATTIWNWTREFVRLENLSTNPRGEEGNELDQFWSAKFLEDNDVAMTQNARKEALRSIDVDHNGRMSLIEYLIWKFKKSVADCANAPQGSLTPEQQRELDECQDALVRLGEALERLRQAEVDLKAEQEELKSTQVQPSPPASQQTHSCGLGVCTSCPPARPLSLHGWGVDAFEAEERKYKAECDRLKGLSEDQAVSSVQRSKANVQLQQLLAEDPLPLRKAKITQEAVVRRVQKEQAPLLQSLATQKAEVAAKQVEVAAQKEQVVQEQQSVSDQMDQARARIDKLKSMGGIAR
eukprot:CAMPEP_0177676054 /NCGR_PEP_ID=MMETSP0447-20121125/27559_1 /TAXON_ID=0 /ORGANISM="Stygamoeba regulata, Strain BSH-02190019" /LENGTH=328 /DNA_ID=CAMNT_0019184541 /DNA_START=38 /DNA_END=1020 /DNA_ORIENTATION=-